jgi:hypothetical protein
MASPIITTTYDQQIESDILDSIQAANRVKVIAQRSFSNFWDKPHAQIIKYAEALNRVCATRSTAERPVSAATIFQDHSAGCEYALEVEPNHLSSLRTPPIDMLSVFDEQGGSINITALTEALAAL